MTPELPMQRLEKELSAYICRLWNSNAGKGMA